MYSLVQVLLRDEQIHTISIELQCLSLKIEMNTYPRSRWAFISYIVIPTFRNTIER